jgi:CubicO group peptidase (beta-lactamase class C family)
MTQPIAMQPVESSQIAAIGHDAETQTLAIRFKTWKGEPSSLYHYANVDADTFAAFLAAESKGRHFGQHIKPHTERFPFTRIESAPGVPAR